MTGDAGGPSVAARHRIAARDWLPKLDSPLMPGEQAAGTALVARLSPAALGDASMVNLPPEAGLCAGLFARLLSWVCCSSRHNSFTVPSALSILKDSSLGDIQQTDAVPRAGRPDGNVGRGGVRRRGIRFALADARGHERDSLRAAGLEVHFGPIVANLSIASAVAAGAA